MKCSNRKLWAAAASAALTMAMAAGAAAARSSNAYIPFANHGGIRDWRADGNKGIWVQASSRAWYYAQFSFPCNNLNFVDAVRFNTEPGGELNRWSSVRVRHGGVCYFKNFEPSDGPAPKAKSQGATESAARNG